MTTERGRLKTDGFSFVLALAHHQQHQRSGQRERERENGEQEGANRNARMTAAATKASDPAARWVSAHSPLVARRSRVAIAHRCLLLALSSASPVHRAHLAPSVEPLSRQRRRSVAVDTAEHSDRFDNRGG